MASDTFTDSNGTALESHDAKWTSIGGAYVVTWREINNNIAEHEATWKTSGCYYDDGQSEDQECQMVLVGGSSSANRHVCVRCDAGVRGYGVHLGGVSGANFLAAYFTDDGGWRQTHNGSWATASSHTLKVVATGNADVVVDMYINDMGTFVDQWTDSDGELTGGHPGMWTSEASAVIDTRYDDWTDNIGGPVGISIPVAMHHLMKNIGSG